MLKVRLSMILLLLTAGGGAACADLPGVSGDGRLLQPPVGQGLVAATLGPLPDVPMPIGFVIIESKSRKYVTTGGQRVVEQMYQGRANLAQTELFYRQNLPRYGWKLAGEQAAPGGAGLRYVKQRDLLDVQVQHSWNVTTVIINIRGRDPRSSAS